MQSNWSRETELPRRAALRGDLEIDTAVIGGGMAGILIAWFLQRRGVPVAVLEADRVGGGQTRNTTAKITCQHGLIYDKLIRNFGLKLAKQYARANQLAVEAYRDIIAEQSIDCDFETLPAYLYSTGDPEPLRREAEASRRLGLDACFTTEVSLPFHVRGAVRLPGQAQFHPLKFLRHIAAQVTVYEQTSVQTAAGHLLRTNRGVIRANRVVFATHYPFVNLPGLYFARMHQDRSYVLALQGAQRLDGMYLGVGPGGCSFRNAGDLLLLGGEGHRTGVNGPGGQYEALRQKARLWYPESRETDHWSAQDCVPMDGVPYIGRYAASRPDWYVATGFQKWGMTTSMAAAMLLSDLICGTEDHNAEIFSPQRFNLRASAKNLAMDTGHSAKGLLKGTLYRPSRTLEELPSGHGGIVRANGKKTGVYKGEDGTAQFVTPRCPHLGCLLAWNPEERSWDCPCHGSRFDRTGRLISGPAQQDIARRPAT